MRRPKIKIVHVLHSFEVGGLENGVVNLINHLDWDVYSHTVCCITRSGALVGRLRREDVSIIELEKAAGNDWWLPIRLARVLRALNPDIVHTRNWGTVDGILAGRLAGVPVVIHGEHGHTVLEVDGRNRKRRLGRRALSPFVDRFVTVSDSLRDWLHHAVGIAREKLTTIYNGVDLARFDRVDSPEAVRSKHGFTREDLLVGTVGRLDPIKDQESLIRAVGRLLGDHPHLKLVVIGDGPCYSTLQALIHQLDAADRVFLLGEREDVPEVLQALDVYVLPSISEGMSNTILEAMAVGLPVIATRVGGNPELVLDGSTGFLVPRQTPEALADALQTYMATPALRRQHGAAGRQRVQQAFSLQTMVRAYDATYTSLTRQKTENA